MGPENGCVYLINVIIYVCYCIFCYSIHGISLSTTRLSICKNTCCQRKKSSNLGKTLCHYRNRNLFVEWPMLTVNATNYREGNFPNPFLVDFFRTTVRMKNPICNQSISVNSDTCEQKEMGNVLSIYNIYSYDRKFAITAFLLTAIYVSLSIQKKKRCKDLSCVYEDLVGCCQT